ncbi:hypothetical protein B0G62_101305 [Paraburkholderia eburnea]|uniref:Glycosyltransferase RgtA/B/C/D-like domain-containing protein n=1 Tax=Paraburkholderia eburnea TaxID=1189126 RepID=A0A2S4MMU2_9BURK|nr:hypothetical protein [Paraburkholderia eburnea]POR55909.1 hypothetical protein B0G62_101305 [Paraburkholderia eburnea]PRZ27036.1 hypothetical protein BX588_101304 [Paraburkholderia eburnea]
MMQGQKGSPGKLYYCLALVVGAAAIYLFFYKQFNTGFEWIFGEEYDAVISAILISHWYHVFTLQHIWNEPLYFYPYKDILGYNDGYFVYGLIGIPFRLIGVNLLVTQELVHITVKVIGFVSMAALLSRFQKASPAHLLGAALFTLSISSSTQAAHGQLLGVAFAPLLGLLLWGFFCHLRAGDKKRTLLYGVSFSVLYGALLLTGFYMAWFFGLFLIVYLAVFGLLALDQVLHYWRAAVRLKIQVVVTMLSFVLAALPFGMVYFPKLKETGGQDFATQMFYSLRYIDILNYGPGSLLWGDLYRAVQSRAPDLMRAGEFVVGFTPDVFVLCIAALLMAFSGKTKAPTGVKALGCAIVVGLLLPLSIFRHSPWFFVNALIPGAKGLRVIARFYLFLAFPITLFLSVWFADLWSKVPSARWLIAFVLCVACLGQVNVHKIVNLNTHTEMAIVNDAPPTPSECEAFFVQHPLPDPTDYVSAHYRQNIQAMLLADKFGKPTLNGIATFNPPDWVFGYDPAYLALVGKYIGKWGLNGVCRYDVKAKQWSTPNQIDFAAQQ